MDYKRYYEEIDAKQQLKKLAKQYKNKKIVVYGAGLMSNVLLENYDLSELNIVAFCDSKFVNSDEKYFSYSAINPKELASIDFDVLLINVYCWQDIENNTKFSQLIGTKNENVIVKRLFFTTLKFLLKNILF